MSWLQTSQAGMRLLLLVDSGELGDKVLSSPLQKLGSGAHLGVPKSRGKFGFVDFFTDNSLWNWLPCPIDHCCGRLEKGEHTYVR